ncbi:MAG: NADH-quinone oxidoreductase subunit K [Desulfurococcales archaeon]|nr:NADH-quinone oxidoreductase subunit K [Desulfurococcales archaeon]
MALEPLVGGAVAAASVGLFAIGVYGVTGSNNLVRQLLSIEVMFNSILLIVILLLSYDSLIATLYSIILTSVVAGEIIVVIAVVVSLYRAARSLTSEPLEEAGV